MTFYDNITVVALFCFAIMAAVVFQAVVLSAAIHIGACIYFLTYMFMFFHNAICRLPCAELGCTTQHTCQGCIPGVCLAVMTTPLYRRHSALKSVKYKTLSLQVSNAGGLEKATASISLLTLHSISSWPCKLQCKQSLYTVMHTQSCFVIFCFMARGHSVQSQLFCLQFQPKFYLLFTPTRLSLHQISLRLPQRHTK